VIHPFVPISFSTQIFKIETMNFDAILHFLNICFSSDAHLDIIEGGEAIVTYTVMDGSHMTAMKNLNFLNYIVFYYLFD